MKTLPLILAQLKGFVRDWKSILLLVVFPLLLICIVFMSFNPDGLRPVHVGVIGTVEGFDFEEYQPQYFPQFIVTKYENQSSCVSALESYNEYVCIQVSFVDVVVVDVLYDNTREPVIWEIIQQVKLGIDLIQREKSLEMADEFLDKFDETQVKLGGFESKLASTNLLLDAYITRTQQAQSQLSTARTDLSQAMTDMGNDIDDAKNIRNDLYYQKNSYYEDTNSQLNQIDYILSSLNNSWPARNQVSSARSTLNSYNSQANSKFYEFDNKIYQYEQARSRGVGYLSTISSGISGLQSAENDLRNYKIQIRSLQDEIKKTKEDFAVVGGLTSDKIVSPVRLWNTPHYIPDVQNIISQNSTNETTAQQVQRGFNLISLQTVFPKLLILIVVFLSLLISSFIGVNGINSPSQNRLRLIPRIFFPEIISTYVSTLIIVALPTFIVMLVGQLLFRLDVLSNPLAYLVLFLVASIFILMGLALSYGIKKESTTLLVSTFFLVFTIFFSGYILPIERMSTVSGVVAEYFSGNVGLVIFNRAVFYGQHIESVSSGIIVLLVWLVGLLGITILLKWLRKI
ncbi:MAG: ABC transporter permease [Candidatus Woesearchaeota archaeon]